MSGVQRMTRRVVLMAQEYPAPLALNRPTARRTEHWSSPLPPEGHPPGKMSRISGAGYRPTQQI
ncbi:hypothetical protein GCM10028867_12590 [Nocardioides pacificus]